MGNARIIYQAPSIDLDHRLEFLLFFRHAKVARDGAAKHFWPENNQEPNKELMLSPPGPDLDPRGDGAADDLCVEGGHRHHAQGKMQRHRGFQPHRR